MLWPHPVVASPWAYSSFLFHCYSRARTMGRPGARPTRENVGGGSFAGAFGPRNAAQSYARIARIGDFFFRGPRTTGPGGPSRSKRTKNNAKHLRPEGDSRIRCLYVSLLTPDD